MGDGKTLEKPSLVILEGFSSLWRRHLLPNDASSSLYPRSGCLRRHPPGPGLAGKPDALAQGHSAHDGAADDGGDAEEDSDCYQKC